MPVTVVTDATFEAEVLKSDLPVLIDLHAEWCEPCKQLSPLVVALSEELHGKLKVVTIDIDANPGVAQSFRVQSIPMLVVIADGQVVGHHLGLLDAAGLRKLVEPAIPAAADELKPEELAQLIAANKAVAVDIRDANAYGRYRIPGAINVPAADAGDHAADLASTDGRVRILYGRSTDDAKELAEKLQAKGLPVGFLVGGFLHWEADGLEVERGG